VLNYSDKPKNQESRGDDTFIENAVAPPHIQPRRGGIVGSPKPPGQVNFNPEWQSVINCLNQDLQDLRIYRIGWCAKLFC
jgi:hypothetical protein